MRRLADFETLFTQVMHVMARNTCLRSDPVLGEIIEKHSKLLVVFNHSTPLSWLPASCLLAVHFCARGGGNRFPLGVTDRFFYHVPVFRPLARFFTQSEKPLTFTELSDRFIGRPNLDLVIFPEGSNCFFGRPDEIQEFRSPKFIELAIRAKAPILVCVHRGSERWATNIPVSMGTLDKLDFLPKVIFDFLERRIRKTGLLTLPLLPTPMDRFEMSCELYYPSLRVSELDTDGALRYQQLRSEAERVREKMKVLLTDLILSDPASPRVLPAGPSSGAVDASVS